MVNILKLPFLDLFAFFFFWGGGGSILFSYLSWTCHLSYVLFFVGGGWSIFLFVCCSVADLWTLTVWLKQVGFWRVGQNVPFGWNR